MINDPKFSAAPEARNREQDDETAQAQSVAEATRTERTLPDSGKVKTGNDTDDAQDLVDHMVQMEQSGQVDMDAYRGERSDDDEPGQLGAGGDEDEGPRGAE
ncbi:MAG: hypothetical protein JNN10_12830 [Sphingopyxis sp.]|uniref:hypothetical protein n=1 Tax=unclassified Sphingopyxis TaxID=2614943 RepID=UPI000CDF3479|nr:MULTISPECIES: hypothetical protein [unclassified Sphingopyxis]AVA15417.1 hypothetical protein C3E99_17540 [Sphingopyxis sp. MG]MBL9067170.1 hypothetical protein [Sphingopyxis sp.]